MQDKSIFQPHLYLHLKNKKIEQNFKLYLFQQANKFTNYLLCFNFIALATSIIISIVFEIKINDKTKQTQFQSLRIISIIITIPFIATFLLKIIFPKKQIILYINILYNYFIFCIVFVILRYLIFSSQIENELIHVMFYIDFIIRFICMEFSYIDFWEIFSINILLIILTKIIQSCIFGWNNNGYIYICVSDMLRVSSIIFSYFILRKKRSIMFYSHKSQEINDWYRSVLDNINSGFIKITNKHIAFINTCALEIAYKKGIIDEIPTDTNNIENMLQTKENVILHDLLSGIALVNNIHKGKSMMNSVIKVNEQLLSPKLLNILPTENSNENNNNNNNSSGDEDIDINVISSSNNNNNNSHNSSNNNNLNENIIQLILDKVKSILGETSLKNQFTYLGTSLIIYNDNSNNHSYFEIYGRYYKNEQDEIIEIILNDVTRTQLEQEKNAEIRYKTTLLSKMAHEFKNPLICLSEIIDDEIEQMKTMNHNFKMVKAIMNYTLILIKDIDMFSQIQTSENDNDNTTTNESKLSLSKINLNELIAFVDMIARYLLKKNRIENKVTFKIASKNDALLSSEIYSDEIKLKQILINLISNSIKFTLKGFISLYIEIDINDSNYLVFTVEDSGIGISKHNQKYLFKSFTKAKNSNILLNKYGAGLGLTITKEISKLLGKEIQFESEEGKGSKFWFSININKQQISSLSSNENKSNCTLNDSLSTIKVNEMTLNTIIAFSRRDLLLRASTFPQEKVITILLADDEVLIRNAMKRKINEYAKERKIKVNVIEAEDGIEIIYKVYEKLIHGIDELKKSVNDTEKNEKVIDVIISDENMILYNGKQTAKKLRKIENAFNWKHIPFFLASAYSLPITMKNRKVVIDGVFQKPLIDSDLEKIFGICKSDDVYNEIKLQEKVS